jgi:transposase-like protein
LADNRVFSVEFKMSAARRIVEGRSVSALSHELGIKRAVLYRWRDRYLAEGEAGFHRRVGRPPGRGTTSNPAGTAADPLLAAAEQIAALERKVGQQALQVDFLTGAFKRVRELRRKNAASGGKASTGRCAV